MFPMMLATGRRTSPRCCGVVMNLDAISVGVDMMSDRDAKQLLKNLERTHGKHPKEVLALMLVTVGVGIRIGNCAGVGIGLGVGLGGISHHLALSGIIWWLVRDIWPASGTVPQRLAASRTIWQHLATSGNIWQHQGSLTERSDHQGP